jgi:hypothetical protein
LVPRARLVAWQWKNEHAADNYGGDWHNIPKKTPRKTVEAKKILKKELQLPINVRIPFSTFKKTSKKDEMHR